MMKKYGIVTSRRIGYQTHYMVNRELIAEEMMQVVPDQAAAEEPKEKCTCEFMPECMRQEGIRKRKKQES